MLTAPLLLAALRLAGHVPVVRAIAPAARCTARRGWLGRSASRRERGLGGYLAALGTQAGEDFSGVVMLWTIRQARVAADAVLNTFIWPWGALLDRCRSSIVVAVGAAAAGLAAAARARACSSIAFGPYAVFHLLFHETATMRYALPLVPAGRVSASRLRPAGLGASALACRDHRYRRVARPDAFRRRRPTDATAARRSGLFEALTRDSARRVPTAGAAGQATSSMHAGDAPGRGMGQDAHGWRVLRAPHGHEWLALVEHWRAEPDAGDLRGRSAPHRSRAARSAGADAATCPTLDPPGESRSSPAPGPAPPTPTHAAAGMDARSRMGADRRSGGITAKDGLGPHVQPSVAWIRSRPGRRRADHRRPPPRRRGRSAGAADPGRDRGPVIDSWEVAPGSLLPPDRRYRRHPRRHRLRAASGEQPAADGSGRMVRVALEQFDLQPEGTVMFGYMDGWQEPEYNPGTARAWRWTSEQARLWVRPVGRDVVLTITGESPLKYFDAAPNVRVTAAGAPLVSSPRRRFHAADHDPRRPSRPPAASSPSRATNGSRRRSAAARRTSGIWRCASMRSGWSEPIVGVGGKRLGATVVSAGVQSSVALGLYGPGSRLERRSSPEPNQVRGLADLLRASVSRELPSGMSTTRRATDSRASSPDSARLIGAHGTVISRSETWCSPCLSRCANRTPATIGRMAAFV